MGTCRCSTCKKMGFTFGPRGLVLEDRPLIDEWRPVGTILQCLQRAIARERAGEQRPTRGVYAIVNLKNLHAYIGSSARIQKRLAAHYKALCAGVHLNKHLQSAFCKYGAMAIRPFVLEAVEGDLAAAEQRWIDVWGYYNIQRLAGRPPNLSGRKWSVARRANQTTTKGRKNNPMSTAHKAKISAANRGRPLSPEHRRKIGDSNRLKLRSPETRSKIASSLRGRSLPVDVKQKISHGLIGRTVSPETRAKISASLCGHPLFLKGSTWQKN